MGKELGLFYVSQGYKVSDGGAERRLSINKYSFELLFKYGIFFASEGNSFSSLEGVDRELWVTMLLMGSEDQKEI